MSQIWELGGSFRCDNQQVPAGEMPFTNLGDLSDLEAEEAELDENLKRVSSRLFLDLIERAINDSLGNRLLALNHHDINELRNILARIFGIGQDYAFGYFSASRHLGLASQ